MLDEIIPIFPSTIATTRVDIDFDRVLGDREWVWTGALRGVAPSERVYQADNDIAQRTEDVHVLADFPEIRDALIAATMDYSVKVLQQYQLPLAMTTSWITRTRPGGFSARHHHSNSWLSGVWYPEASSTITFTSPMRSTILPNEPAEYNIYNAEAWTIRPESNMLVIFPSYLQHQIDLNDTDDIRYSLAFNTFPVSTFGVGDSTLRVDDVG
jgi:uncharacterized protein (TIGR02466 family)